MHTPSQYRRYLLSILATCLGLLCVPAILVLVIDPMQVYHRHVLTDVQFIPLERFQNVGLINQYLADDGVDSLVIGTSMSQNFISSKVNAALGWKRSLPLTLSGGTPHELRVVLERALQKGSIRNVLWEIHTPYLDMDTESKHEENLFPTYLYNDTIWDDWHYPLSHDAVKMAIRVMRGKYHGDLDRVYYWMDWVNRDKRFEIFNAPSNIAALSQKLAARRQANDHYPPRAETADYPNIDVNVFDVVQAHPDINFVFYMPPISTLEYALMEPAQFMRALAMRRYVLEQTRRYANTRLYAFDDQAWIVANIRNYKDLSHYGVAINEYILQAIQDGRHRLTPDTIETYEQAFEALVKSYTLDTP